MRVVGILNGQFRQRRGLTLAKCSIQQAQLTEQHPYRPAVSNDMVHIDEEHMLLLPEPVKPGAQQWPPGQVEGLVDLLPQAPPQLRLMLPLRAIDQVKETKTGLGLRHDKLQWTLFSWTENGPQHLVTANNLTERSL